MKFCTNCGAQLSEGALFCTTCGAPVEGAAIPVETVVEPSVNADTQALPPVTSAPAFEAVDVDTLGTPNGSNPKKHNKKKIALIAVIVVIVLSIGGFFGYQYYRTHSHPYAVEQYTTSLETIKSAKKTLESSIAEARKDADNISLIQVEAATLVASYTSTLNQATDLVTTSAKTVLNPETAPTEQLLSAATENNENAEKMNQMGTSIKDKAQAVVNSKKSADKILGPVEAAVTAAEKQKAAIDNIGAKKLNISAIARGDYSSLDGTWTNSAGAWVKISNGQLTPQTPILGTTGPYPLVECTMDCASNALTPTQHQLLQEGAVARRVLGDDYAADPYELVAVQKGAALKNTDYAGDNVLADPTDSTRDRIIPAHSSGQGGTPLCANATCAYYRESGDANQAADASAEKLDADIKAAQAAIDKLTQNWATDAKQAFQKRLDALLP